jgi:Ca2+-binding EF-hand superfamily protein
MADADWLRLQKVVFARYVQQKLRECDDYKDREVKDVVEEMKDATLLVDLMEVMSGTAMKKKIKPQTMRIKLITNANEALKFVESCGVNIKTVRVSAEDIVDGAEKVVMALVFQIIIKYLKFEEEGDDESKDSADVRESLCLWLNNKTDGYNGVDKLQLKNKKIPTKAFHNGLIFNALVHKMRPRLVDYDALNGGNGPANLAQALELGEKYLNIEKYVSAEDIPKMDELSIIVYLSDWFNGVILLQRQDVAACRIGKLVDLTILHDKLKANYTTDATAVADWVRGKIEELNKREFDDTLAGIRGLLEAFYSYKGAEKGEYLGKKLDATGEFNNLQARLANHKRPVWVAPEGTSPTDLDARFAELAEAEIKRSVDMNKELARQIHLHKLYNRLQNICGKLGSYATEKKAYVDERETIDSVDAGEDALEALGVHEKDQEHVSGTQLADLAKLSEELTSERFEHKDDAASKVADIKATFDALRASSKEKRTHLEAALQEQKDINDNLCKAFADVASAFEGWLSEKRGSLAASSEGELEDQLATCQSILADTAEADGKMADINAKYDAVQARNIGLNPHTNLAAGDLQSEWTQYQLLLKKKIQLIEEQIAEAARGGLSDEQQAEIDSNFNYFDKDNSGCLGVKELRACLQSLGEESKPANIAKLLEKYDTDNSKTIKHSEFVEFMKESLGDSGTETELLESFKCLSYNKDVITETNLANVINNKSFKQHHHDYLLKECPTSGDGYDYASWNAAAFAR